MQDLLEFTTQPIWDMVIQIRKKVKFILESQQYSKDIVESTEIAAMELLENAVKYGVCTVDCPSVDLKLKSDEQKKNITIVIANGITDVDSIRTLTELLEKLKNVEDVGLLYMERLEQIMANPKSGKSQLGLLRIVYETGFNLDYKVTGTKLEIIGNKIVEETIA